MRAPVSEEAQPFAGMKKRKQRRRPIAAKTVTLTLPELDADHPEIMMKVLTSTNPRSTVAVELRADVLSYVRAAIVQSGRSDTPRKRERNEVEGERGLCRWIRMQRKKGGAIVEPQGGFQAFRVVTNGGAKTRFFPCEENPDPDAIDRCRELAMAWAKGECAPAEDGEEEHQREAEDMEPGGESGGKVEDMEHGGESGGNSLTTDESESGDGSPSSKEATATPMAGATTGGSPSSSSGTATPMAGSTANPGPASMGAQNARHSVLDMLRGYAQRSD